MMHPPESGHAVVVRHATGQAFLSRAEPWLLRAEAENNLVLGLARQIALHGNPHGAAPYLATLEQNGEVAGCSLRTPPWKLILTAMPDAAVHTVVADVARAYGQLPAVLGPVPVARTFAGLWSALRGCRVRDGMRQRLYSLERVITPTHAPPGRMRFATPDDLALVQQWLHEFVSESVPDRIDVRSIGAERIARRELAVWDDGTPRCMAGFSGHSPNGVRVGYVYTPLAWRRRGYATACVAALSQCALDEGARYCFLYTDLSNPVSNSIYQRIGYEAVGDAIDMLFEPA